MKFTTFLLPAMLSSTALAAGPLIFGDKFSRESMRKWQKSISQDSQLNSEYKKSLGLLKTSEDAQYIIDCADNLKLEDIQLFSATGSSWKKVGRYWQKQLVTDMSNLNDITFIYLIKGGQCGVISVGTDWTKNNFISSLSDYKWRKPIYSNNILTLRKTSHPNPAPAPFIDLAKVELSTGEAFASGKEEYEVLKDGFQDVILMNFPSGKEDILAYKFQGMKGDKKYELRDVYISAVDGRLIKSSTLHV